MTILLALSSFAPSAQANPIDFDGDGYAFNAQSPMTRDCDDTDPAVSPKAQEIIGDMVDQDCDGHDALRRTLVMDFYNGLAWTTVNAGPNGTNDLMHIGPAGSATHNMSIYNPKGVLHLVVEVDSKTQANCSVALTATPSGGSPVTQTQALSSVGTNVLSFPGLPDPTRTVTQIRFACPAGASVDVDWWSLQNLAATVFPPGSAVDTAYWRDVNAPGGGLASGATRLAQLPWSENVLLSGSDNAGVGIKYVDAGTSWQTVNGSGPLTGMQDLSVWDVAGVEFDGDSTFFEIFALSGEVVGDNVLGTLWYSADEGGSWEVLADSLHEGIGMAGRYGECPQEGDLNKNMDITAGQYLVPDMDVETPDHVSTHLLWIASNYFHDTYDLQPREASYFADERDFGVYAYSELEGLCDDPVGGLPSDRFIGAIARATGDEPYLVVGFRAGTYVDPLEKPASVYVCPLPTDAAPFLDVPVLECDDLPKLICEAVPGSEGLDVSDIEVDPFDRSILYISDGGDDPLLVDGSPYPGCRGFNGAAVSMMTLSASGHTLADISDASWAGSFYGASGVSMDPDGDYLFAFMPGDFDPHLDAPFYRIHRSDILTGAWEQPLDSVLDDATDMRSLHDNTDFSGGWLETNREMTPYPFPELTVAATATDAIWYTSLAGASPVDHAVIMTRNDMWDVMGLDDDSVLFDAYSDAIWVHWPEPDVSSFRDFESMSGGEMALDHDQNLWLVSQDKSAYMVPAPNFTGAYPNIYYNEFPFERDCLFELYGAGGSSVSVGQDGAIWFALHDQAGGVTPHDMGVFRAVSDPDDENGDHWDWSYQGAGVKNSLSRSEEGNLVECRDYPHDEVLHDVYLTDVGDFHRAAPMGTGFEFSHDKNFINEGNPGINPELASWGNPRSIRALDENIAVVAFQSYSNEDYEDYAGTLAYTLNGGVTWTKVQFDPFGDCAAADPDGYNFYSLIRNISLVKSNFRTSIGGASTYWKDLDEDGVVDPLTDDWRLDVLLSSGNATSAGAVGTDECNLARVTITPTITSTKTDWEWIPIPHYTGSDTVTNCRVGGFNMTGMTASPWSNEVFIWGKYSRLGQAPTTSSAVYSEWGGACSINLNSPHDAHPIISPMNSEGLYELDVGTVAPNPYVSGVLLIGTGRTLTSQAQCKKKYIDDVMDGSPFNDIDTCPKHAPPYLASGGPVIWSVNRVPGVPAALNSSSAAWTGYPTTTDAWAAEFLPDFYYGSTGGGTWQAKISW